MTELEKLAMLHAAREENPTLSVRDNMEYAYEAGFRKAREMAEALAHKDWMDDGAHSGLIIHISRLGDAEVKE